MRILLAGDTHGNLTHIKYLIATAASKDIQTIVQLGDFGYWPHYANFDEEVNQLCKESDIEFFWLDGNHECFDELYEVVDATSPDPQQMHSNLWYLPRGSRWEWAGMNFMAFGGAYSIDKERRVEGVSWWAQELPSVEEQNRALDRLGTPVDVLLTHDAPEGACPIVSDTYKGDEISAANRRWISALVAKAEPAMLAHGHYHHAYQTSITIEGRRTAVVGIDRDTTGHKSWETLEITE